VMLCSVVQLYWRFGGPYCLHLHGRRVSRVSKQQVDTVLDVCQ
jgi:hypothetical protein